MTKTLSNVEGSMAAKPRSFMPVSILYVDTDSECVTFSKILISLAGEGEKKLRVGCFFEKTCHYSEGTFSGRSGIAKSKRWPEQTQSRAVVAASESRVAVASLVFNASVTTPLTSHHAQLSGFLLVKETHGIANRAWVQSKTVDPGTGRLLPVTTCPKQSLGWRFLLCFRVDDSEQSDGLHRLKLDRSLGPSLNVNETVNDLCAFQNCVDTVMPCRHAPPIKSDVTIRAVRAHRGFLDR
jgi:hypothetical protein